MQRENSIILTQSFNIGLYILNSVRAIQNHIKKNKKRFWHLGTLVTVMVF
jgi:hypothetical protein